MEKEILGDGKWRVRGTRPVADLELIDHRRHSDLISLWKVVEVPEHALVHLRLYLPTLRFTASKLFPLSAPTSCNLLGFLIYSLLVAWNSNSHKTFIIGLGPLLMGEKAKPKACQDHGSSVECSVGRENSYKLTQQMSEQNDKSIYGCALRNG